MEIVITNRQFGKEWHVGTDIPQPGKTVYALVEEDMCTPSEPILIEASVEWKEGHNPPLIWNIPQEDGTIDSWSIAGGHSVYLWRYK